MQIEVTLRVKLEDDEGKPLDHTRTVQAAPILLHMDNRRSSGVTTLKLSTKRFEEEMMSER